MEKTLWPKIRDAKLVVIDPDDEKLWKERAMTVWPKYEGEVGGKAVLSEIEKIKKDIK